MAIFSYDMASFYAKTVSDHSDAVRGDGWFTETAPFVGISAESYHRRLALMIKTAFVERFLDPGTGRFGIATQTAQATALHLGLVPEGEVERAAKRMVDEVLVTHDGHIAAGIFGTKYLLNALSRMGHVDVAYRMVDERSYPGWGYMLENGAMTLWETWAESDDVYSQNHPMFGSVSEWFCKSLGGIEPEESAVGFDRFRIEPDMPAGLEWVDVNYESVRGTIKSSWRLESDRLYFDVEIPVNTTALVQLPTRDSMSVREAGRLIAEVSSIRKRPATTPDAVRFELGSGRLLIHGTGSLNGLETFPSVDSTSLARTPHGLVRIRMALTAGTRSGRCSAKTRSGVDSAVQTCQDWPFRADRPDK